MSPNGAAGALSRLLALLGRFPGASWLRAGKSARDRFELELVVESGLFDADWYRSAYPDVAEAAIAPLEHFMTVGWREGRNPGPMFTTNKYLRANEDVARSGTNPLLHYIEFGIVEGREAFGDRHTPLIKTPSSFVDCGEASECLSLFRKPERLMPWLASGELDKRDQRLVTIGGSAAGYAAGGFVRDEVIPLVDLLELLSGNDERSAASGEPLMRRGSPARLIDGWYLNLATLRTRWQHPGPLVVRAFQCDPNANASPNMVAEAAVRSPIDWVDVDLINPFFPLLFLFTDLDGEILGQSILCFPSLCRGGAHYAELVGDVGGNGDRSVDITALDQKLAAKLIALRKGEAKGGVAEIVTGSSKCAVGPSDLRMWLDRVMDVPFGRAGSDDSASGIDRKGGATLSIPEGAVPTIRSLVAHGSEAGATASHGSAALLMSALNPSRPSLVLEVPAAALPSFDPAEAGLPKLSAGRNVDAERSLSATAIGHLTGERLSDAERLIPNSGPLLKRDRPPISWLIIAEQPQRQDLLETIHSIALQHSAEKDRIALVGAFDAPLVGAAGELSDGRVAYFRRWADAVVAARDTELAAFIRPGVLLHDAKTANVLAALLIDEHVLSASCAMVSAERRSGMLKSVIVDGGAMLRRDGEAASADECSRAAAELWRRTYPVARPCPQLWLARQATFQRWAGSSSADAGLHLCSSQVTAIAAPGPGIAADPVRIPMAPAVRIGWLVG